MSDISKVDIPADSAVNSQNTYFVHKALGKYLFMNTAFNNTQAGIVVWDDLNGTNEHTVDLREPGQAN